MGLGTTALVVENTYFLLFVLLLMGSQSAFFGPVKYSILPTLLQEKELIGGNAIVEAGTFLSILVGTSIGALFVLNENGTTIIGAILLFLSFSGWLASLNIPSVSAPQPSLIIDPNIFSSTYHIVKNTKKVRSVFLSILGISWFWLTGAVMISQFPNYAKTVLNSDNYVVTLFLVATSIGIGVGSMFCNLLLKAKISAKYVPVAAFGIAFFIGDLWLASPNIAPPHLLSAAEFIRSPENWRILFDLFGAAIAMGIFVVPLYAIVQSRSDENERSRIIAGNNILNSVFILSGTLLASVMLAINFSVPDIFLVLSIANFFVAIYICKLLPETVIKALLAFLLRCLYRVEVRGIENYVAAGDRSVVIANHVSWLDGLLIAAMLPGKPTFAIYTHTATKWWMRPFISLIDFFPIDPTNPHSLKSLINVVRQKNRRCVIFPEGRITVTGALMKIYEGPGLIADKANAPIVPIRIDGAQYSTFSRLKGKVRTQLFPKIYITVLPPQRFDLPDSIRGRERRHLTGLKLYDLMCDVIFDTCDVEKSLFSALADSARTHGYSFDIVEDTQRKPISFRRLIQGSYILGRKFSDSSERKEIVGVLLPNTNAVAVTFFALQAYGRIPAMLNFSAGLKNLTSAINSAQIKTVLTSRRFVKMAELEEIASVLSEHSKIVYLEDLQSSLSIYDKCLGLIKGCFPRPFHKKHCPKPNDPAVVLFTSGSEGSPKGVVLSHSNILANVNQLTARVDFNSSDIVFNALPVFHSFGLTGGLVLPILSGVKTFLYPSPLHYRIIPALVYSTNATIMFGTSTFLSGYARSAHPYDFYSVRYVFAGAEKVRNEVRNSWAEKFGLRILEGYGATETSPVLATNTPMHYQNGSVGRFLPSIDYSLEPVPGIEKGGKLFVKGPNVMLGYLREDKPGILQPLRNELYDTGDIISVDAEGFVTIEGRVKRFAKIAGEMVSLTAVEEIASAVWQGLSYEHAAITVEDARKGEQIILITNYPNAQREQLLSYAQLNGIPEMYVPKVVTIINSLPVLPTGKIDYMELKHLEILKSFRTDD